MWVSTKYSTGIRVLLAVESGGGDFYATKRALAKWRTEALIDAATVAAGPVPRKFAEPLPTYREPTREEVLFFLCGWASYEKLRAWSEAYEVSRQAAIVALPEALEELGAAL
jgi:hypothetical protein